MVSRQFDLTRKSKGVFSVAKNIKFIEDFGRNRQMRRFIAINGPDDALTKRFRASLKKKNAGQTKFIKPNSQR